MVRTRRVVLLSSSDHKLEEIRGSLSKYGVESVRVSPEYVGTSDSSEASCDSTPREALKKICPDQIWRLLHESSATHWVKAVFKEDLKLVSWADWERYGGSDGVLGVENNIDNRSMKALWDNDLKKHDMVPVVAISRLTVWSLPKDRQAALREAREFRTGLTHVGSTVNNTKEDLWTESTSPINNINVETTTTTQDATSETTLDIVQTTYYESHLEGFVDFARRLSGGSSSVFGWDDIFVVKSTGLTFQEMKDFHNNKISPRDQNVNRYIIDALHYNTRKRTNFIFNNSTTDGSLSNYFDTSSAMSAEDSGTIVFDDVGKYVAQDEFMNNSVAVTSGLTNVFISVVNSGVFFRSAKTRREVNYWLPGLNAGIPFVAKKDAIHESTFNAHDFGHFIIPDLIYTGGDNHTSDATCSSTASNNNINLYAKNYRNVYILYRMMSEATTLVFADMLFVESLRLTGKYPDYDWSTRKIHPLFQATGLNPFQADSEKRFCEDFRSLLEANVQYCLLGDDSLWRALMNGSSINSNSSAQKDLALANFKEKYMPFFVEDYQWTAANYENMSRTPELYQKWWRMVKPLVVRLNAMSGDEETTTTLETVEGFMAAIGVCDQNIEARELIDRIFKRVWETRIQPVFDTGDIAGTIVTSNKVNNNKVAPLLPYEQRLTRAFFRYMIGQFFVFAKFDYIPITQVYMEKLRKFLIGETMTSSSSKFHCNLSARKVRNARELYNSYLRLLESMSLLTKDDVQNYSEIFPLFDPVFVHYDEGREFYEDLSDVWQKILLTGDSTNAGPPGPPNIIIENKFDHLKTDNNHNIKSSCVNLNVTTVSVSGGNTNNIVRRVAPGVLVLDSAAWWSSVPKEVPLRDKLGVLLKNCGCEFWDDINLLKPKPVVALSAIGGIPIKLSTMGDNKFEDDSTTIYLDLDLLDGDVLNSNTEKCSSSSTSYRVTFASLVDSWKRQMAYASFPTYLNPRNLAASDMYETVIKQHQHFSVAHTVSLSFTIAGLSCAVENELNSQRDLVHVCRLTVARTAAQASPPLIVPMEELVEVYKKVRKTIEEEMPPLPTVANNTSDTNTLNSLNSLNLNTKQNNINNSSIKLSDDSSSFSKLDWHEGRFTLWPSAKAHIIVVSASLRNFQKLVADLTNTGKEREYRSLLWHLNQNLAALFPDMFKSGE